MEESTDANVNIVTAKPECWKEGMRKDRNRGERRNLASKVINSLHWLLWNHTFEWVLHARCTHVLMVKEKYACSINMEPTCSSLTHQKDLPGFCCADETSGIVSRLNYGVPFSKFCLHFIFTAAARKRSPSAACHVIWSLRSVTACGAKFLPARLPRSLGSRQSVIRADPLIVASHDQLIIK